MVKDSKLRQALTELIEQWDQLAKENLEWAEKYISSPNAMAVDYRGRAYAHCVASASELIGREHGYKTPIFGWPKTKEALMASQEVTKWKDD